jgi:hypothetical protein
MMRYMNTLEQLMSEAGELGNTTTSAIESYFEQGSSQGCNNPCCGNCSSIPTLELFMALRSVGRLGGTSRVHIIS